MPVYRGRAKFWCSAGYSMVWTKRNKLSQLSAVFVLTQQESTLYRCIFLPRHFSKQPYKVLMKVSVPVSTTPGICHWNNKQLDTCVYLIADGCKKSILNISLIFNDACQGHHWLQVLTSPISVIHLRGKWNHHKLIFQEYSERRTWCRKRRTWSERK